LKKELAVNSSRYYLGVFYLFFVLVALNGCDTVTPSQSVLDVGGVAWLPDASGMIGFTQQYVRDPNNTEPLAYNLSRLSSEGGISGTIVSDKKSRYSIAPEIFISDDGTKAIVQLDSALYRVNLATGDLTPLASKLVLYAVSPDLRTAVITNTSIAQPVKTISVLDISTNTARKISEFQGKNLAISRGLWLTGGRFALTTETDTGRNLAIYDTNGQQVAEYPNGEVAYHSSGIDRLNNRLYVLSSRGGTNHGIDVIDLVLEKKEMLTPLTENVESFDIGKSGSLIVYVTADSTGRKMKALNVQTGATALLSEDYVLWDAISPMENRVAYVVLGDNLNSQIKVKSVSLP